MATRKNISFDIVVHATSSSLESVYQNLMGCAVKARANAYAPYSKFHVGAAVLLANGEIVLGNNQENASYPAGLCAERVAVFYAGANFPGVAIKAIAISATSTIKETTTPAAPCGNCRQSISEYEFKQGKPIKIFMMGKKGKVLECESLNDLLPLGFNNSFLD